ncbi:titin-like [Onthophagus taurus]|uniref:titin-like n=1 Tax=Onthophagus taurus TaxID=166361 RepID=UPI000C209631|nr:serrate RNA effector molecule homolog [Onthophagus taurus]
MNGNVPNYPEHLNPFKSKGGLRNSFRKVFRSFTGKDRQRPDKDLQRNRITIQLTPQNHSAHVPEALPRSRFKERLEKTEHLKRISTKENSNTYEADNPFDEQDLPPPLPQSAPPEDIPPVPAVRSKLRKKKKKRAAPLPPGITSSDGQYLEVPSRNGSKWSLTSTDTDASSICYSENEEVPYREEETQQILEITRKIAEFTDDTNNNLTFSNEVTIKVEDVDENDKDDTNAIKDSKKDEEIDEKISDFKEEYEIKDIIKDDITKNDEDAKIETDEIPKKTSPVTNGCANIDHNQNSILRVKIIDNEEVVLRHPEDYYDDDNSERESLSIKEKIQHFESYKSTSPTSKVRQTILTKENLLGTE